MPSVNDDPRRRPIDRARFCRRDRRSLPHPPLARRRRLSGPGSKALSVGRGRLRRGISKCGDRRVRTLLYEAANVMLTRYKGQLKLKDWAFAIARRSTMRKARIALARRLAIIMHAMLRDRSTYGRLRFQPSRPAPSLPHQAPNERAENTGIPRRRDPEEASPLTRSAAASKSPVRVKGRTLERHRLSRWPVRTPRCFRPRRRKLKDFVDDTESIRSSARPENGWIRDYLGAAEAARGIRRMIAATMTFLRTGLASV